MNIYYYKTLEWELKVTDKEEIIYSNSRNIDVLYIVSSTKEEVEEIIRNNNTSWWSMLLNI